MKNTASTFIWPALAGLLFAICLWLFFFNDTKQAKVYRITSFAQAVNSAKASVASINTTQVVYQQSPQGFGRNRVTESLQSSLGSAVIVDASGYLLTNHHVIKDADAIVVTLFDGRTARAKLVGTDEESDLAVLWIDLENLSPIRFGNPKSLHVGDIVLAIGNPFGFGHTVTQGIVSAMNRWGLEPGKYENYIQTDADINVGNSGGALIDVNGELIGINSAIYSRNGGSTGIGLAIPVDIAEGVMRELIQQGQVIRGWLGISVQELNIGAIQQLGLDINNGVLVTNVAPGGPASFAGLQAGDIIVAIDGSDLQNGREGMLQVASLKPGQRVRIDIFRNGHFLNLNAVVGKKPTT